MNRFPYAAAAILLFLLSCKNAYQIKDDPKSQNLKWSEVMSVDNSTPTARHEAAFVNVSDNFYLLGGRGIKPVSIYNPQTQKWTLGAKPPIEFHHFQPVVYQDKVYIIGALTGKYPAETPVENVYIYDTTADNWIKGDPIPTNRLRGSTGNILKDNIIYMACGISNGHIDGHKQWLDSYNIETGEWNILPDAPRARDHFQAVEANNKVYVLAGRLSKAPKATFSETIAQVDVFDIENGTWSTLQNNLPTERAGNMAIEYNNNILVIGGESINQNEAHNEVEALNLNTNTWFDYPSLIQGRHGTGVIKHYGQLFIASGCGNRGGSPELNTMETLK